MQAKKSLGQNFLNNPNAIKKMVESLSIAKNDIVIEIGPGKGALTHHLLLEKSKKVIVIEKDPRMVTFLRERFEAELLEDKLVIKKEDFLNWIPDTKPYKLIGNIPFYITGRILRHIFDDLEHPTNMTLLMQKEVGDRILIKNQKNSILATAVHIYSKPKYLMTVKPGSFSPKPKVSSAIINFKNFSSPFTSKNQQSMFFDFLHELFSGKRKMITTNLKDSYPKDTVTKQLALLGHKNNARAEDLAPQEVYELFLLLQKNKHCS